MYTGLNNRMIFVYISEFSTKKVKYKRCSKLLFKVAAVS